MINKNIINYIRQNLARGVNPLYIQNTLVKQGYSLKDVYDSINYVKGINHRIQIGTNHRPPINIPIQRKPLIPGQPLRAHPIQRPPFTRQPFKKPLPPQKFSLASFFQKYKKSIFIYGGIFISLIVIVFLIILLINSLPKTISASKLSEGTSFELKENKDISFNINGEEHKLTTHLVHTDSVDMTLQSEPTTFTITIGEVKKFDLNDDNIYDLHLKLTSIQQGVPSLFIIKISEEICTENWNCTNWSACSEGNQTRKCTDINNCRTIKGKPIEQQECETPQEIIQPQNQTTIPKCFEKNGTICNLTQICDGFFTNASYTERCCIGKCVINQSLLNQDKCSVNEDCYDSDLSTKDVCSGSPKNCLHSPITQCIPADSYCPTNCSYPSDSDCQLTEVDSFKVECGEDIWCYHDRVVGTNNYTKCFDINKYWNDADQGVVGNCIYTIAVNLHDCSICTKIVKQDTHTMCVRDAC